MEQEEIDPPIQGAPVDDCPTNPADASAYERASSEGGPPRDDEVGRPPLHRDDRDDGGSSATAAGLCAAAAEPLTLFQLGPPRKLSATEDAAFRKAFTEIDTDGGGTIDADEMLGAMHSMGLKTTTAREVAALFEIIDANGDGDLDIEEFLDAMSRMPTSGSADAKAQDGSTKGGVGSTLASLLNIFLAPTSPNGASRRVGPIDDEGDDDDDDDVDDRRGSLRDAVLIVLATERMRAMRSDGKLRKATSDRMLGAAAITAMIRSALEGCFRWHGAGILFSIAALELDCWLAGRDDDDDNGGGNSAGDDEPPPGAAHTAATAVLALRALASLCALATAVRVGQYYDGKMRQASVQQLADAAAWTWSTWPGRWRAAAECGASLLHAPPLPALARSSLSFFSRGREVVAFTYSCGVAGPLTRRLRCTHGLDEVLVVAMLLLQIRFGLELLQIRSAICSSTARVLARFNRTPLTWWLAMKRSLHLAPLNVITKTVVTHLVIVSYIHTVLDRGLIVGSSSLLAEVVLSVRL